MADMKQRRIDGLVKLYKTLEARDLKRLESLSRNRRAASERRTRALEGLSSADPISIGACTLYQSGATRAAVDLVRLDAEIEDAAKMAAQRKSQLNRFERRQVEIRKARAKTGLDH